MKEFIGITREAVYKEKILPAIQTVKDNGQIPDSIKLFLKSVITIGNKASKPLFQMFQKTGNKSVKTEEAASGSAKSDTVDPILKNFLKWLTKEVSTPQTQDRFEKDLYAKTINFKLPSGQTFNDYLIPINQWLFSPDHGQHLATVSTGKSLDIEMLESVKEAALTLLAEYKIDHYFKVLDNTFKDKLPEIIHKSLEANSTKIADILSARMANLLKHTDYGMTIDRLLLTSLEQTQGFLLAEKGKAVHQELISDAKKAVATTPADENEKAVQKTCQDYLAEVNKVGEEKFLHKKFVETYTASVMTQNGQHPSPHGLSTLKEVLINYGSDQQLLDQAIDTVAIPKLSAQIAKEFINLMLPEQKKGSGKRKKWMASVNYGTSWSRLRNFLSCWNMLKKSPMRS